MSLLELSTDCPIHNQWIECVWNLASAEIRMQQADRLRHTFTKEEYQEFISMEFQIFHSWAGIASEARQVLSLNSFYN